MEMSMKYLMKSAPEKIKTIGNRVGGQEKK
jgi:hypothetical protein